jgi:hypothetical protein
MSTENEKTYFGNYTLEKIYDLVGRNDYTSTITFRSNSQSEKLYGNKLTIVFLYTQQEREGLENNIKKGVVGNHGYVKAKYLLFDLPDTKIKELEKVGVNSNDITDIEWLPYTEHRNTYGSKEKRHINTIAIESKPCGYENDILWMYGALKTYKEKGIGLCPEEQTNYLAYKLILEPTKLTEEEKADIYDAEGKMNEDVAYVYLGFKCVTLNISKEEIVDLMRLCQKRYTKRMGILNDRLKDIGCSIEKLKITEPDKANFLINAVRRFHEKRYNTYGNYPLYLNLEGFLHIYLRHVEDLQIGSQYAHKDKFQLYEKDIEAVISRVLHGINTDYQVYKSDHPTQRYGKYGKDSYYLLGDYYTIQVNEDGSIGTFYKNRTISNK